jgi:hypothetical protein
LARAVEENMLKWQTTREREHKEEEKRYLKKERRKDVVRKISFFLQYCCEDSPFSVRIFCSEVTGTM